MAAALAGGPPNEENMDDIYESGIPKYSTAEDIYDALCELCDTEEMSILADMGADVSYDSQSYYYTEKGTILKEKFEELADRGDKMWLINIAVAQIDEINGNEMVYECLINDDLSKRIGFKKLFVATVLQGNPSAYEEIIDEYENAVGALDWIDYYSMNEQLTEILNQHQIYSLKLPYSELCNKVYAKIENLKITDEIKLVYDCRALLTSYDDFIYGLKVNQSLYTQQENAYSQKVKQLQEAYTTKLETLLRIAGNAGLLEQVSSELKLIEGETNGR